jgi:hypothetical protein
MIFLGAPGAHADTAPAAGTPATVSADVLPTWQVNGVVWSTVTVGNTVYATGEFSAARPPGVAAGGAGEVAAGNIFAFDITTGNRVATFNHTLNAQGLTLARSPDGSRIYVGGDFTSVDGVARNRIAAFNTATGALVTAFYPRPYSQVAAIAATNSTVYYGGTFNSVGGVARARLAAANAADGALTSWAPTADNQSVKAMVLAPDGSRVIVGGQFTTLNGVAAYGMGSLSTSTGATMPWAANTTIRAAGANGGITSLRTDGTLIYGTAFAFGSGASFEGPFGANPTTGALVFLNDCHGDTYDSLAVGQVLYMVSHAHDCSAIHQFPDTTSPRIAHRALAFTTYATGTNVGPDSYGWNYNGKPASSLLHWYPTVTAGTYTGQSQGAWALTGNSTYVVLGGEFPSVNGIAQAGLVRFAVSGAAPNKVVPQGASTLTPVPTAQGGGAVKLTWKATWDLDNQFLTYKVQRDSASIVYTSPVTASSFWQLPNLTFTDTGLAVGSTHSYKIQAVDPFGNIKYTGSSIDVTVT